MRAPTYEVRRELESLLLDREIVLRARAKQPMVEGDKRYRDMQVERRRAALAELRTIEKAKEWVDG